MKLLHNPKAKFGFITAVFGLGLVVALVYSSWPARVQAQNTAKGTDSTNASAIAAAPASATLEARTNGAAPLVEAPRALDTNKPPAVTAASASATNTPTAKTDADKPGGTDEMPLSFQGANIEMVVQWLAKTTGKSVVKHPRVQCQLTIVSSKNLRQREALNIVYRALNLEGFTVIESSKSILIVPEGQEPKMSPEIVEGPKGDIPEGRQRLLKIFSFTNVQAGDLRDKVRAVLSEKAAIEVNDRVNQLMVTDYNENLVLLDQLIKALDVPPTSDTVVEIFALKHLSPDDMTTLLGMILNAQTVTPPASSGPSSSSTPSSVTRVTSSSSSRVLSVSSSTPTSSGLTSSGDSPPPPSGGPSPSSSGSASGSSSQVRFWSDRVGNRLIVSATKLKMAEVHKLIDLLDTEKAEDMGVRVIGLNNVSADDLVREIGPLYQKLKSRSPKDTVEITANHRSNSLIVLSSEANFKAIEKLIGSLDTEAAQEKTTRAFPLKNADAEDVAKQLQELAQGQDNSSRYPYYIIYGNESSGGRSNAKLSVVADRRRNTVIVQAPPNTMESVTKMVQTLDEPVADNSLAPKIIALKFVSAIDIEDVLNELFLKKTQTRSYYYYDDYPQETADKNVGRLYGKVRITSEPFSNCIIITANSLENLVVVEEVIKKLDSPSEAGDTTLHVELKFAKAVSVANSINVLYAKSASPALRPMNQQGQPPGNQNPQQQQQNSPSSSNFELEQKAEEDTYFPWLGGQQENIRGSDGRNTVRTVSELVGRVRVVPDKRGNAIMVNCNVHFFPQIIKLINELDAPTAQVLIEARIVEVSSNFLDQLGVRWSPDGSKTFSGDDYDNSFMASANGTYSKQFTGSALAGALKSGVLNSKLNLDLLIQVLRKNTDATVLAAPLLNISDNEMGRLFVGSRIPLLDGSMNLSIGGRNDSYRYSDVGVILDVTPHINNDEEVALKIRAESSSLRNGETVLGGPIIDTRNFRTDLLVKSGQTVVLGGIIQREQQTIVRKVPILGSIPVLGWAFKKKDTVLRNAEMMVFLSPKVSRSPEQARAVLNDVEQKVPSIKAWMNQTEPDKEKLPKKTPAP